jgi:hypothetical protein
MENQQKPAASPDAAPKPLEKSGSLRKPLPIRLYSGQNTTENLFDRWGRQRDDPEHRKSEAQSLPFLPIFRQEDTRVLSAQLRVQGSGIIP